ncbi:hypothetical protein N7532_005110 [Penicillium argentinense]|uniref:Rhomboid-type serine protease n=1 Tax=Penicillium argentinense TaxID=1131581 RepID=A0A9W9FDG8_9EURO|nr:uncharacterized protein N7532_005110 [Penicillium argentinense]KAJ5098109.1 hypothetical protein N7532_005110 [Penicillium argentinense]
MAANDYYHANIPSPPSYEQAAPGRTTPAASTTGAPGVAPGLGYASSSPSHRDDPSAPYHNRESQQSFLSDGGYHAAGRVPDGDHYAENIPLKAQTQFGNNPEWMQQQTQYPPYPASPGAIENRGRGNPRQRKRGFFKKKPAFVTWTLTVAMIIAFIIELVKTGQMTGSPITKPSNNPFLGPSAYMQIYMGARFTPCMKNTPGIQDAGESVYFTCPNATTSQLTETKCTLSELCGFGGVPNPGKDTTLNSNPAPNQWFRFILPIFLHGGFIHIAINLFAQMFICTDMERLIGPWRFALAYFASGIFGYVLGGNYASQTEPSVGCSGALFGIMALFLLDLLYDWPNRESRWVELIVMIIGIAVSFVLGLLPDLDNFSHIGGFVMGLAIGLCIMRSPNTLRERIGLARQPYVAMSGGAANPEANTRRTTSFKDFFHGRGGMVSSSDDMDASKSPLNFFKGRKPLWWAWWLIRAGALVAVLIGFIMLIVDFYRYHSSNCSWCYRLSCLPVNGWCDQATTTTTTQKAN